MEVQKIGLDEILEAAIRSACGWHVCRTTAELTEFCSRYNLGSAIEVQKVLQEMAGDGRIELYYNGLFCHTPFCRFASLWLAEEE